MGKKQLVTDEGIGGLVRERRRAKGIGQPELAEVLEVSPMMVQKYETGQSPLTVVKLVKIAQCLGCKPAELIP